jgi:A/G-specific adenine glycosylase
MSNQNGKKQKMPNMRGFSPGERRYVRAKLLRWYDKRNRFFPWRGESDPYRVWVSEVMLQQTRTDTVAERYPRFVSRFPTLKSLADAPLEAVLSEWEGLGYYNRARNLHRAARIIAESRQGNLPADKKSLNDLPGFGPYIAGAVSSIAFGERAAAMDGNFVRVLSRLLDISEPVDMPAVKAALESEAETLVPPSRPGDFNQAMMDLGATICLPRNPRCQACPLSRHCSALAGGTAMTRPIKTKKKAPPREVTVFQLWAESQNSIRLVRREEKGLFGGMWELPGLMMDGRPLQPDNKTLAHLCQSALGPGWRPGKVIARLTRTLTHRKILFVVLSAVKKKGIPNNNKKKTSPNEKSIWAGAADIEALPLPTAQRAVIQAARDALPGDQENLFD